MNDEQAATKLDMRRVLPIFLLVFVDLLGLTVLLPLLHLYAAAYGGGALEIGLVIAAFPLAQMLGVPVMGALSDRYGRKPLLLISQITTCVSFIMLGLADSLALIILSRVIDGLFGANLATARAALADITDSSNRARGLGLIGAAFGLGFTLGPLIAIITVELTDSLALPAFTAAFYSFISILITAFVFKETLPKEKRGAPAGGHKARGIPRVLLLPGLGLLLFLMFAQQLVFFGFESMLGLFTLTRLGLLGQGNAALFLLVGIILVVVQARYIGRWTARFGERALLTASLLLLALGLLLSGTTPRQTHPFYVREIAEHDLLSQAPSRGEMLIGALVLELPENGGNGIGGVLWLVIALVPLSIGAGLIRPVLNSLITQTAGEGAYGRSLGASAALTSGANAMAPLLAALLFQGLGASMPFILGGIAMAALCLLSAAALKRPPRPSRY